MAWNPDPKVAAAREFGRKYGKDVVIILSLNTAQGTIEYVSYGKTKDLCSAARKLADVAFDRCHLWICKRRQLPWDWYDDTDAQNHLYCKRSGRGKP